MATSSRRWSPCESSPAGRSAMPERPSCSSAASASALGLLEDPGAAERLPASRMAGLGRQPRILARRHFGKQRGDLEGARNAEPADLVACQAGDRMAGEPDRARARPDRAGDDVEQRRLARAVGADDGAHLAFLDAHGDLVERDQGAIPSRHAVKLEQRHVRAPTHAAATHVQPSRRQSPDPLRGEQDEGDEDQAEVERPCLGPRAELVLHQHEERRTQDRADQRARAADDHHDQHLSRQQPEQQLGVGEARERCVERASEAAQRVGDGHHGDLVETGVVAERDRLGLVLANAAQHRAERRAHQGEAEEEGADQAGEHEIVEAGLAGERGEAQGACRARNPRQAIRSAGHRGPLEGDGIEQLGEGERQHREGNAGRQRAHPSDADRDEAGQQRCGKHREQQRHAGVEQQPAAGIGPQAIGGGMAERNEPCVAEHEVEAHGEQPEDQRLGEQRHGEGRQSERRQRQQQHDDDQQRAERGRHGLRSPCRAGRPDASPGRPASPGT